MKTALLALCAASIAAAAHAQNASEQKPGLWESRTTKMTVDGKDMLESMKAAQQQMRAALANMPPEQRKKMEATLGAQGSDPLTQRVCLSAEMLKNPQAMAQKPNPQANCAPAKVERSGNRTSFESSCKSDGETVVAKGVSVITGDQANTSVETVVTSGGKKQVMQTEAQMKFISSDCGGLQPLDEIAKKAPQAGAAAPAKK